MRPGIFRTGRGFPHLNRPGRRRIVTADCDGFEYTGPRMGLRFGATARLLVLGLLLLAVSPATAPFSSFDPLDLFGGHGAPASSSITHKSVQDPQVIACTSPAMGLPALDAGLALSPAPRAGAPSRGALHIPLRI